MIKQWHKIILVRFWSMFISFAAISFIFYASIHYSLHAIRTTSNTGNKAILEHILYYISQASINSDFLIPQLIILATIIVMSSLQNKRELVLLMASGLSRKKLISPILLSTLLIISFQYANYEWLFPISERIISEYENKNLSSQPSLNVFYMKDQSILTCNTCNISEHTLFNSYWIPDVDTIYSIEQLIFADNLNPIGKNVLKFKRDDSQNIVLDSNYDAFVFHGMKFDTNYDPFTQNLHSKHMCSLTELSMNIPWKMIKFGSTIYAPSRAINLFTKLGYKLLTPLIYFAAVIIPASICLVFKRVRAYTGAYIISLGAINIFFVTIKSGIVLANNNIIPALHSMLIPYCILIYISIFKFIKIK